MEINQFTPSSKRSYGDNIDSRRFPHRRERVAGVGSFDDARVVRGRARADAQSAARGLEKASRGHDFEVCGLFVGTKPARVCLATEKKMLITASAVKFAELGGDEALKEEQSYLQPPTTRRYR